jgi:uncharacterized protein YjiS (DUF1127 family)
VSGALSGADPDGDSPHITVTRQQNTNAPKPEAMRQTHDSMAKRRIVHMQHIPHVGVSGDKRMGRLFQSVKLRKMKMAYMNSTRTAGFGMVAWARATLAEMKTAARLRNVYLKTLNELQGMTDRDLADINVSRH